MKMIFMAVLLAWGPDGQGTPDSGPFAYTTLPGCYASSRRFSARHGTPVQQCLKISAASWLIISSVEIEFDFGTEDYKVAAPDTDKEVKRLRHALRHIGKLHVGTTRDSRQVRAIIRKATEP